MPNDQPQEFDEDLSFAFRDLSQASERFISFLCPAPPALRRIKSLPFSNCSVGPKQTSTSPIVWQTSMLCPMLWGSHGRLRKTFPLARWPPSLAFPGTSPTAWSAFQTAKRRSTWKLFRSGRQSTSTTWMRHKSSMENYYTLATSYLLDALTSPTWRPSWGFVTIVLSARVTHPFELWGIYHGGRKGSPGQMSSDPSLVPFCNTEWRSACRIVLPNHLVVLMLFVRDIPQTLTIILLCNKARVNRVQCPLLVRPRASTPFLLPPPQDTRAHPVGYRGST